MEYDAMATKLLRFHVLVYPMSSHIYTSYKDNKVISRKLKQEKSTRNGLNLIGLHVCVKEERYVDQAIKYKHEPL